MHRLRMQSCPLLARLLQMMPAVAAGQLVSTACAQVRHAVVMQGGCAAHTSAALDPPKRGFVQYEEQGRA